MENSNQNNTWKICCCVAAALAVFGAMALGVVIFIIYISNQPGERNAPIPTPTPTPTPTPVPMSDLLGYFREEAFYSAGAGTSGAGTPTILKRINKPIASIEVVGDSVGIATAKTDAYIAAFNNISATTKLHRIQSGGDIKIIFRTHDQLAAQITDPKMKARAQYGWTEYKGKCNITGATIYLETEYLSKEMLLNYTVAHELTHAIGLSGHDAIYPACNLMTHIACAPVKYFSEFDSFAIKALYNTGIPTCIGEQAGMSYINTHLPQ